MPAAGAARKEKAPATPEELTDWVTKANGKLAAIDPAPWTEEERSAFTAALEDLQETIGGLLSGAAEAAERPGQNFS